MLNILNNVSLKVKLLIVYLVLVFVLINAMGYYLLHRLNDISYHSSIQLSNIASEQLVENFTNKMTVYYGMVETVKNNLRFTEYLYSNYTNEYDSLSYYINHVESIFSSLRINDNSIEPRVFSNNDTIKFSKITNNSIDDLRKEGYLDVGEISDLGINWAGPVLIDNKQEYYIGCYKAFTEEITNELKAVLIIFFREEQIYSLFSKERESGKIIFIYDGKGKIISSTERGMLGRNIEELAIKEENGFKGIKNNTLIKYNDKNYLMIKDDISNKNISIDRWGIINLVPTDKLFANTRDIWLSTIIICIVCAIISSMIIILISKNVTGRIGNLITKMENVKKGDFKVSEQVSGQDEIGVLESNFYDAINKIDTLIKEVYLSKIELRNTQIKNQRIEMEKKEAEIIALQGQINPHYLFNTLETIRMNLLLNGDEKTANIILMFGESFRACFDRKTEYFTLSQEIHFINNYIQIQKYRYGDKINCIINIPEHMLEYSIPKLILQPIVENAIYHGLEPKRGKGTIIIEAFEDNTDLYIRVTDDGIGMDSEEIIKLKASIYSESILERSNGHNRIALRNVYRRLQLIYGEQYSLSINSQKGKGTTVEINIKKSSI